MSSLLLCRLRDLTLALVCCAPALVQAASSPPVATGGDPLDAAAAVPPLPFIDAFSGYQLFQDEAVAPWRDSNAAVAPQGHADGSGGHEPHGAHGHGGHGRHDGHGTEDAAPPAQRRIAPDHDGHAHHHGEPA